MYVSSRGSPEHRFDSHLGSAAAELVAAASAVAEPLELVPAQRRLDKERVGAQSWIWHSTSSVERRLNSNESIH